MKHIAFIMSFLILFLAVEPGINAMVRHNDVKEKTQCCCCCKHHCKAPVKQQNKKKSCCDYADCNPFAMCQCCVGFVLASSYFQVSPISFFHGSSNIAPENMHSIFFADFWQPPKIS